MIREIIKEAMKFHDIGPSAVADAVGIRKSNITGFLAGRTGLSQSKIESVFRLLGIEIIIKRSIIKHKPLNKRDVIWNNMLNKLKSYHANTEKWPSSCSRDKNVKKLGLWCVTQRAYKKSGKISDIRKQMLDSIGFDWGVVRKDKWLEMFEALKKFRDKTGKWPLPTSDNKGEAKLGVWLCNQRAIAKGKRGYKMPQERLEKLESINFMKYVYRGKQKSIKKSSAVIFDRKGKYNGIGLVCTQPRLSLWNRVYEEVKEYRQSTGNWPALNSQDTKVSNLCLWCNRQREYLKRGCLSQEKQAKLNAIGFEWVLRTHDWNAMYEIVKKYRESTGKWPVASPKDAEIAKLGRWCGLQRHRMKKGILSSEQQTKLKEIEM